jgi:hypothetical protein
MYCMLLGCRVGPLGYRGGGTEGKEAASETHTYLIDDD